MLTAELDVVERRLDVVERREDGLLADYKRIGIHSLYRCMKIGETDRRLS
jgi:hypothetical protein